MTLIGLRDERRWGFAAGRQWPAGDYEAMSAVAEFAVDPACAANRGIVDLDRVTGADGRARFDADLRVLRPRAGGNGELLVVVPNRGLLGGVPFSLGAQVQFADLDRLDPGDGFVLRDGFTVAWCGWQWDVPRRAGSLGLGAPAAAGAPGWLRVEFRPDDDQPDHPLSDSSPLFSFTDYPTADVDDPDASLTVRLAPDAPPLPVPRDRWRFAGPTTVVLDGGFRAFHYYTLTYRTPLCPVAGAGLLAVRDATAWLRARLGVRRAYAFGVSQSGRFLRQFLFEGRNVDETGRVVFDGVFAHLAGARRGEFNHRYAQPSLTHPVGFGNLPPYDTAGLLAAPRPAGTDGAPDATRGVAAPAAGTAVRLMLTNSSWEYWRGDGALVHVDPETGEDLPDDPDARVYLLRGTDHFGPIPFKELLPGANPVHTVDVRPVLRALFVALTDWVRADVEPPPSAVPRWHDGTAATRDDVLRRFATAAPDGDGCAAGAGTATGAGADRHRIRVPDPDALPVTRALDLGPDAGRGVGRWPPLPGAARPAVVAAVDTDGNETAGVALPLVAVPVAAYTGWNPRRPVEGLPNPLYEFLGSALPLLTGRALPARDTYGTAVRAAADRLVTARLLLPEDLDVTVREALAAYDAATARRPGPSHQ